LGISDLKTIERIQWYYNTYFNETYGGGEQWQTINNKQQWNYTQKQI
jgi:hypothetical protein